MVVRIDYHADNDEQRLLIAGLFQFFDLARPEATTRAVLRFAINRELIDVLERSKRWGRIKAEVFCSMRSRYAITLYELLELRRNMHRCIETFPIERFRELMGVKPDAYRVGFDFQRSVIKPAIMEVNGLSDLGVKAEVQRKHERAPIHAVTLCWWQKSPEEMSGVLCELGRSKLGRRARLQGQVKSAHVGVT